MVNRTRYIWTVGCFRLPPKWKACTSLLSLQEKFSEKSTWRTISSSPRLSFKPCMLWFGATSCWCLARLSSFSLKMVNSSAHVPVCFFYKIHVYFWPLWHRFSDPLMPWHGLFCLWYWNFNLIITAFRADSIHACLVVWTASNRRQQLRQSVLRRPFWCHFLVKSLTFSWSKHAHVFLSDNFGCVTKNGQYRINCKTACETFALLNYTADGVQWGV